MDKLARYNQKLLAVLGTLAVLGLTAILLISLSVFIIEAFDSPRVENEGLQVNNVEAGVDSINAIPYQISFHKPIYLDTATSEYLIPVGQKTPAKNIRGEYDADYSYGISKSSYSYRGRGIFNNFILYEHGTGTQTKIFENKIALTEWAYKKVEDARLLLFAGTEVDHNKNNKLDEDDYQSLYVFYMDNKQLKKYSLENKTVLNYEVMRKTDLIYVEVGVDRNRDLQFKSLKEPTEIYVLNVKTKELKPLVPEETIRELHNTLRK